MNFVKLALENGGSIHPRTDTTTLVQPQSVKEGTIVIFPSYTLHYVNPNQANKIRTILSFDLLPKLPEHQRHK